MKDQPNPNPQPETSEAPPTTPAIDMRSLEDVERDHIKQVVAGVLGNKSHAARILGIDRRTLYRKLAQIHAQEAS